MGIGAIAVREGMEGFVTRMQGRTESVLCSLLHLIIDGLGHLSIGARGEFCAHREKGIET